MNRLIRLGLLGLLVVGLLTVWEQVRTAPWLSRFTRQPDQTSHSVVLERITALGKLELVRYTFKDIVEHEQVNMLLPNSRAVLIVEGEAVGCIDLTRLKATDIDTNGDSLIVQLPAPELCTWKINHDRSRVYDTNYTFLNEAQLVSDAYRQAERQVRASATQSGIMDQTRRNAVSLLQPMLTQLVGKPVGIRVKP
ncbi:DUF4230 domain-containing protein [Fibrella forsythiae]|uniref:DUF4230 domain-containing protein n=1 Tax=Fibrella forsythiae TaxID=2817061 RepID=A0ABS3JKM3_9BACT|nr:DUF4230 domain-containing protein [Fibrella forsythiae]MBO0950554.1 DUF4230 domain-containing protein [Fibrella forsythiae]